MEKKYESDLTKKEKRELEIAKLKKMNFSEKLEYIWMYYKAWIFGALGVIFLIYVGFSMYQGSKINTLAQIVIVGGNEFDTEKIENLEEEIKQYLGNDEKHDQVLIQSNIPDDPDAINVQMALEAIIGANGVDVLICPQRVYEDYASHGMFEEGGTLEVENKGKIAEILNVEYDKIYIGIPSSAPNKENGMKILEKMEEYSEK